MNERTFNGFMLSVLLHALVAVALIVGYLVGEHASKDGPRVLELVAGEGDNYMATEAPALGTPGGIKLKIPDVPTPVEKPAPPEPSPVEVAQPEPKPARVVEKAPVAEKSPVEKAVVKKEEPVPNFAKNVQRIQTKRATRLIEADRKKREAAERKAKEAELKAKRMTKAEFDAQNKAEAVARKNGGSPKISRIDAEGIAKGVRGGSTNNKVGGASGTALTREEGDVVDGYVSLLARKVKLELDERPGVGAGLTVEVEIHILADGTITGFRMTRSSGSTDFDQAVREAFGNISLPPRPKGLSEVQRFPVRGVED